ncbi:MAG: hypothetical protein ACJ8FY_28020 [Gemmataceae bacterium]
MTAKRILSIGQCGADHGRITRTFGEHFNAEVVSVDNEAEATLRLREGRFDLILVNRILDSDGSSGVQIIKHLKANPLAQAIATMLVSNYEEAQEEAVKNGALEGFGKGALGHPEMMSRLRRILEDL